MTLIDPICSSVRDLRLQMADVLCQELVLEGFESGSDDFGVCWAEPGTFV
jgi:hypothetical protein